MDSWRLNQSMAVNYNDEMPPPDTQEACWGARSEKCCYSHVVFVGFPEAVGGQLWEKHCAVLLARSSRLLLNSFEQ